MPGTSSGASRSKGSGGTTSGGSNRGFAAMDAEKQREIARKGGQASHGSRSSKSGSSSKSKSS